MAHADEEVTLIDTVSYSNVQPGEELTLKGILMDKETGEALEIDGETVTSELTFTPESSEGTVDVEFTFNATEAAGKTLIVFESLYYGRKKSLPTRISIRQSRHWFCLLSAPLQQIRSLETRPGLQRRKHPLRMWRNIQTSLPGKPSRSAVR